MSPTDTPIALDVLVAQTARTPDSTRRDDRYITTYWYVEGEPVSDWETRPAAKLTVQHDKDRKRYVAELERTDYGTTSFGHREAFTFIRGQRWLLVAEEPAARFSAKRFAEFEQRAQLRLAALRDGTAALSSEV